MQQGKHLDSTRDRKGRDSLTCGEAGDKEQEGNGHFHSLEISAALITNSQFGSRIIHFALCFSVDVHVYFVSACQKSVSSRYNILRLIHFSCPGLLGYYKPLAIVKPATILYVFYSPPPALDFSSSSCPGLLGYFQLPAVVKPPTILYVFYSPPPALDFSVTFNSRLTWNQPQYCTSSTVLLLPWTSRLLSTPGCRETTHNIVRLLQSSSCPGLLGYFQLPTDVEPATILYVFYSPPPALDFSVTINS
ncbi:hypothetical protein BaRGS_00005606 [Batillaria attramentaria]|uniref:Uncharacterized protein n=1 Tax=Batillaria attramentaria TaxID=370345 RepID=A0ABD0LUS3_9CAEN